MPTIFSPLANFPEDLDTSWAAFTRLAPLVPYIAIICLIALSSIIKAAFFDTAINNRATCALQDRFAMACNKTLKTFIRDLLCDNQQLVSGLAAYKGTARDLARKLATARTDVNAWRKTSANAVAESATHVVFMRDLLQERAVLLHRNAACEAQLRRQDEEISALRTELEAVRAREAYREASFDHQETFLQSALEELQELRQTACYDETVGQLEQANQRADDAAKDARCKDTEIADLLSRLRERDTPSDDAIAQQHVQLSEAQAELIAVKDSHSRCDAQLREVLQLGLDMGNAARTTKQQLEETQSAMAALRKRHKGEMALLHARDAWKDEKIASLEEDIVGLNEHIVQLEIVQLDAPVSPPATPPTPELVLDDCASDFNSSPSTPVLSDPPYALPSPPQVPFSPTFDDDLPITPFPRNLPPTRPKRENFDVSNPLLFRKGLLICQAMASIKQEKPRLSDHVDIAVEDIEAIAMKPPKPAPRRLYHVRDEGSAYWFPCYIPRPIADPLSGSNRPLNYWPQGVRRYEESRIPVASCFVSTVAT
ncbi:hypothetical protein K488DRAFT_83985 [Vararia minispora EC-137]|uniref:Uncharacterized protein n=1 Tax=Vararia minispora EC-137 TaxID=1314806 RepID=A0ACB8QS26_9AGAM|nr:hypothetical protein K488DRAFT_83985 [Vararia minispora EC-137]